MACNFNMGEDGRNVYPKIMLEVSIPLTTFNWHIGLSGAFLCIFCLGFIFIMIVMDSVAESDSLANVAIQRWRASKWSLACLII